MRRFYAFLVMLVSIVAIVIFNVQGQYYQFNSGIEFSRGTQITYLITPDEDNTDFSLQEVAELFSERLEEAGAKDYYVDALEDNVLDSDNAETQYQIQIRVAGVEAKLSNILRSVEAHGEIRITTQDNETTENGVEMVKGSATVDYEGSSAYVKIEVTDEFSDEIGKKLEGSVTDENGQVTSQGDYIIIWSDYDETTDSYEEACKGETIEQRKMQEKIIAVLDSSAFSAGDDSTEPSIKITNIGFNANATSTAALYANSAHSVERLLNSEPLDYEITRLYTQSLDATYGNDALLFTSIAAVVVFVAIAVFLFIKYGINGLAGAGALLISLFLSIVVYNFFSQTITPAFILSFVVSAAMGLTMIVTYLERYKNEIYKGRTPAKANKDAYKLTQSTALDATIFSLVSAIIISLVSRNSMQNFFVLLIISSLTNIVFCFLIARLMMYLITNSKIADKKKLFRIKEEHIPNVALEESQTYFGEHENFDTNKHAKKSLLAIAILAIVSVASISIFSIADTTFNYNNEFNNYTTIQIVDTNGEDHFAKESDVENFFKDLNLNPYEITTDIELDPNDEDGENQIYYIEAKFSYSINEDDAIRDTIVSKLQNDYGFEFIKNENESADGVYFFNVEPQVLTPNFNNAMLLILLTAVFAVVYSTIRYRYTFTLATLGTIVSNVLITTGLISLTRVPVSSNLGIALVTSTFVLALLQFILLIKNSQLVKESKTKVTTYEQRKEIIETSLKRSITPIFAIYLVCIIALVIFAIFSNISLLSIYIVMALNLTIGVALLFFAFVPVYLFTERNLRISKLFKKKKENEEKTRKQKEKRRRQEIQRRRLSAEPEEVIIPGIND